MDNGNLDFYDLIIDIESFNDLKSEGWKIEMSEDGLKKYDNFKSDSDDQKEAKKKLNRIGILGVSGVGKTFILKKLIDKKENTEQKKTKGISVIYPEIGSENLFVCIDSQGSEEPIIDKKQTQLEIFNLKEKQRKDLIKSLTKDKKFTEIFIQDFIIEKSNILIVVVDQLTFSEQKLINRLKNNKHYDKLFVIHNTQFFGDKKIIEEHIDNVVKKSIFSNLEKECMTNLDKNSENKNEEKAYYYKEKNIGNENNKLKDKDQAQEVIHLFMGKEGSEAGKYFNEQTIEFIRFKIKSETRTKIFDVLKEVKSFLSFNSIQYMLKEDNKDRPIKEDEIDIVKDNDMTYLKCKESKFELKNCIINELGISNFTSENSINPSYICYLGFYENKKKKEKWKALVVKAEMFVDSKKIKISQAISDDNETMNIAISCDKQFEKDPNIVEEIEKIDGGDIKAGNMRISIKFNLHNFTLDSSKPPQVKENLTGIKEIYFKIEDKDNKREVKEEIIDNEKKKKKKEKK